jgi:hypothetical protein
VEAEASGSFAEGFLATFALEFFFSSEDGGVMKSRISAPSADNRRRAFPRLGNFKEQGTWRRAVLLQAPVNRVRRIVLASCAGNFQRKLLELKLGILRNPVKTFGLPVSFLFGKREAMRSAFTQSSREVIRIRRESRPAFVLIHDKRPRRLLVRRRERARK